jgi:hypothetical protein
MLRQTEAQLETAISAEPQNSRVSNFSWTGSAAETLFPEEREKTLKRSTTTGRNIRANRGDEGKREKEASFKFSL